MVRTVVDGTLRSVDSGALLKSAWPEELSEATCTLIAAGKASARMASAVIDGQLAQAVDGVIVAPPEITCSKTVEQRCAVLRADHPLPTERNLAAASAVRCAVESASRAQRTMAALLSGGASAHLTLPRPGISLHDLRIVTGALMRSGADIHELNAVRKHIEVLKGGGLAQMAAPAPVHVFVLSDVTDNDPSVIASGPFSPDSTTFAEALDILVRHSCQTAAPVITAYLRSGAAGNHPETRKPGDKCFGHVTTRLIGSNEVAVNAAAGVLNDLGFPCVHRATGLAGEARALGAALAQRAESLSRRSVRGCMVIGGETTVTVRGAGRGGRNTECALGAALVLRHLRVSNMIVMSFATDGVDGVSPAAGAWFTSRACASDADAVSAEMALARSDSWGFMEARRGRDDLGSIETGPTQTNVNDVVVFAWGEQPF